MTQKTTLSWGGGGGGRGREGKGNVVVCLFTSEHAWKGNFVICFVHVGLVAFQIFGSLKVAPVVISQVTFVMTSWFYFVGCNKPKIDQGSRDKQLVYRTGQLVSLLFSEVCKHTTSMGLLKSYESDECSSEEPVETLSEE